jgi:hypothetical protein
VFGLLLLLLLLILECLILLVSFCCVVCQLWPCDHSQEGCRAAAALSAVSVLGLLVYWVMQPLLLLWLGS